MSFAETLTAARHRDENEPEQKFRRCAGRGRLVWCDLTFRLKLGTPNRRLRLPARSPLVRNHRSIKPDKLQIRATEISSIDTSHVLTVRSARKQRPLSFKQAAMYAVGTCRPNYLPETEPAAAAQRILNFASRQFFKGRSRRTTNPERLPCVVAVHDRNELGHACRSHVHMIVELPSGVGLKEFRDVWKRATKREPFVNRRTRVESLRSLQDALTYILNPKKSSTGYPLVHQHTRESEEQSHEANQKHTNIADDLERAA